MAVAFCAALLWAQIPVSAAPGKKAQKPQNKVSELETPVATFHGTVKSLTKKEIVLDVGEEQSITFNISHKTKFLQADRPVKPASVPSGAKVTVEGKRDLMGNIDAVAVTVEAEQKSPSGSR